MDNFNAVFECHPDVDRIFVVDGMPFLQASHAQAHANTTKKQIQVIDRKAAEPQPKGKKGDPVPGDGDPDPAAEPQPKGKKGDPVPGDGDPAPAVEPQPKGKKGK
jgi:hypothetical protein